LLVWLGGSPTVAAKFSQYVQKPQMIWVTAVQQCLPSLERFVGNGSTVSNVSSVLPNYKPGLSLVAGVLTGVMQYATFCVLYSCCVIVLVIAEFFYGDFEWWNTSLFPDSQHHFLHKLNGESVVNGLKSVSLCWAMFNLLLLYFEIRRNKSLGPRFEELHPEGKFVCIKLVVFFTAIQKFVFETVLKPHLLKLSLAFAPEENAALIENFLISLELFLFSVMHMCFYPVGEFNGCDVAECQQHYTAAWKDIFRLRVLAHKQSQKVKQLRKNPNLEENELAEIFGLFDADNSGSLSYEEFDYILSATYHSQQVIDNLLPQIDGDGDMEISFQEFFVMYQQGGFENMKRQRGRGVGELTRPLLEVMSP